MALRKPLVDISGETVELPSTDTLDATLNETEGVPLTNGESSDAITIGMPVYISAAGTCKKAKADAVGTKEVFGLMKNASVSSGGSGVVMTSGQLTSADWTAVTGSANLTAGSKYYLSVSTGGQMSGTPISSTGYDVEIGQAISTTIFQIRIRRSIQKQ